MLFATGLNGSKSKQTVSVKATYIHPRYEAYSVLPDRSHNIALLKLIKPFDMCNTEVILPNVTPVSYDNNYISCLIFGWQSYVPPSLKVFAKPIQYNEVFLNSWKLCTYMIKTNVNYTNVFCTMVEFEDEMKACAGNPGSPVICENQYHEIAVLGIASWTNFSLECGNLPTYLDLGEFRMWIHSLINDNEETKDGEATKKSNEEDNKSRKNINMSESSQNGTDLLQINYWSEDTRMLLQNISAVAMVHQETSRESTNKFNFLNRLYPPVLNNFNETTGSNPHGYRDIPYSNMLKQSSNDIYRYEEVGKTNSLDNQNYIIDSLINNKQLDYRNKSLLCNNKNFDGTTAEPNKDITELNGFELLLPFNFEDITAPYSSVITIYSINLCLLLCILVLFWCYY
ncbi:uncharacterized protein LOC128888597 [Hylaeus anthracinus]|uniref:uncharacterized protein LOC128888597 n=1 Tax=Hylaeus anthracinus TaxID=313031 RepID=UPI0023B912BE|nr:uncharacterized protein LOC128888597 [Hylaeus anthracinus]